MSSLQDNNVYWIKSIQSGKCLDICQDNNKHRGSAIIYDYYNSPNQQFIVKRNGAYFSFISKQSGKALSIEGNPNQNGSIIRELDFINSSNQMWKLAETSPNSEEYLIVSGVGDKVLDVCNEKTINGTAIFLYDWKKSQNQIWQFIHADDGEYPLKLLGSGKSDISQTYSGKPL